MNYELGKKKNRNGFTALMATIIISVILFLIASTLSMTGFAGRLNILDSEYKERSVALSEACVDVALLKLAGDQTYTGNVSVPVGLDTCNIQSIDPNINPIIIKTKATFQKAVTNLEVKVSKSDLSVVSWQEVPNF